MLTRLNKLLAVPGYGLGTVLGAVGFILIVPGGLIFTGAMAIFWLLDRFTEEDIRDEKEM